MRASVTSGTCPPQLGEKKMSNMPDEIYVEVVDAISIHKGKWRGWSSCVSVRPIEPSVNRISSKYTRTDTLPVWQDISTALEDHTSSDILVKGFDWVMNGFDCITTDEPYYRNCFYLKDPNNDGFDWCDGFGKIYRPTHWMHIPEDK